MCAAAAERRPRRFSVRRVGPVGLTLLGILVVAAVLRLWGVKQGLPYAYNVDEDAHFVPQAIGMFGHGYNPHYFLNPPAYTYMLHLLFAVWFGGRDAVGHAYAVHPTEVFVLARVLAGALSLAAVWLTYLAGARLFDRRTGLLASALLAVAFLPVFYSHLALNDVPTLAPVTLSLVGTAGVLRRGRALDWLLAGAGVGLAAATKYTAGIVLVPLLGAAAVRLSEDRAARAAVLRGLGMAALAAAALFLLTNPYALLDFHEFKVGVSTQSSTAAGDDGGKLGLTQGSGILYYLWTFTWGLGWVPALAALAGAGRLVRRERRLALVLVPGPLLFLLFMGTQDRYFGRWLMPVLPIVCLLAAHAGLVFAGWVGRHRPRWARAALAAVVLALLAQGAWASVHNDLVLARADTRTLTRDWMVAHVPPGARLVIEPVVPNAWLADAGSYNPAIINGARWRKLATSTTSVAGVGKKRKGRTLTIVRAEDYERTLRPELLDVYRERGYCWVVTGSTQYGRASNQPSKVPRAIAYYAALAREATLVYHASPYGAGEGPVKFNFDWSFDYYPGAYARPGPEIKVYRLRGCTPG